jgi:hypothetical protein
MANGTETMVCDSSLSIARNLKLMLVLSASLKALPALERSPAAFVRLEIWLKPGA